MDERIEQLVPAGQARDEWEGTILVGYLHDNGLEATLRRPSALPPFDTVERLGRHDPVFGILVLEHDQARAKALVDEFRAAVADETLLAETAAQRLHLDQDTIHQLRGELSEEKRTFALLGWIGVVLLGATAWLWIIWPAWLRLAVPPTVVRCVMVLLLTLGAVLAGSWASRRMG